MTPPVPALTILGASRTGQAMARYAIHHGWQCMVSDGGDTPPEVADRLRQLGVAVETGGHSERVITFAPLAVPSPGIKPEAEILRRLRESGVACISEPEFTYREIAGRVPVIGITGTNGKSTTTLLIAHLLTQAGLEAPACGNLGIPIIQCWDDASLNAARARQPLPNAFVVELSSAQLALSPTLTPEIAVLTNLTPDHLDWHGSLEAYVEAKRRLFAGPTRAHHLVLPGLLPDAMADLPDPMDTSRFGLARLTDWPGNQAWWDANILWWQQGDTVEAVVEGSRLQLAGDHNRLNAAAAAVVALRWGLPAQTVAEGLASFAPVAHRLEPVPSALPLQFINDSKATNPEASQTGVLAYAGQPLYLLAGGYDKGTDLTDWAETVARHVRHTALYGAARSRLAEALEAAGAEASQHADLQAALMATTELARQQPPNGRQPVILLSPACASFDQFRDYEARGEAFRALIEDLG